MKKYLKVIALLTLLASTYSHASLISVNATADMSSGFSLATDLLSIGTNVTADIQFDVGDGSIQSSIFSSVSGEFSWLDSILGLQTFSADDAHITTINSDGWFNLNFSGIGPVINGITADSFSVVFDIGINPYLAPGNTTELYDLILNSSIENLRVGALQNGLTHYGVLDSNVSGTVSATSVPEPGIAALFFTGLIGLMVSRRQRKNC